MDQFRDQLGNLPEGGMGVVSSLTADAHRAQNPKTPQRNA
jgi:hypothetical protein